MDDQIDNQNEPVAHAALTACKWCRGGTEDRLDFEAQMSLRMIAVPVFHMAQSWSALGRLLAEKGFAIRIDADGCHLDSRETGQPICSTDLLGYSRDRLIDRFGPTEGQSYCVI